MTIGERIKQRRIELNMSQEELAKKMGYSTRNAIYQFEKKDNMKLSLIEKFAEALETTPSYLMGWEDATQAIAKAGEEISRQMQPLSEKLKLISRQVDVENEKFKKAVEIFEQIEVLPADKKEELIKYLRYLQSQS